MNNPLENPKPAWQYQTEELVSNQESIVNRGPHRDIKNKEQGLAALKLVEADENSPAAVLINLLRNYAVYTPNTPVLRGIIPDQQTREPVGLSGGRLAEALKELQSLVSKNELIEDAFDEILALIDWINDFDTTSNVNAMLSPSIARPKNVIRFSDRFMKGHYNQLTAYDASEGALYILFCAVLTLSPNSPSCLAIDNLDQTLNPRLVLNLTRLLGKWITEGESQRQIFVTVHNPAVLDGLRLQDDRIRLFTVDRNNRGHTEISRVMITEELLELSNNKGWPLSRLWVMGQMH
ncbi:MAG: AAA family ATPase [Pseudomonadota bacterium]